jgi:hypothetical protein
VLLAVRELPHVQTPTSSKRSESASLPTTRAPSGGGSWWFRRTNHHGSARRTQRRHVGSRAMPTAPRDGQRSSARRYFRAPTSYTSSSKRQGCRRSAAHRPTWVRLWHVSRNPLLRLTRLWLTSGSPQPWWKRVVQRPNLRCLHRADTHVVDLINMRTESSTPSRRKSTSLRRTTRKTTTYAPTSIRIDADATLAVTLTSAIASAKSGNSDVV